jgi:hypothetical protein
MSRNINQLNRENIKRIEIAKFHLFLPSMILFLLLICSSHSIAGTHAPYPPNKIITKLKWDPEVVKMEDFISEGNWPILCL